MCPEVANCHFDGIATVTYPRYKLIGETICVTDVVLHIGRNFIVKDMLFWSDAGMLKLFDEGVIATD